MLDKTGVGAGASGIACGVIRNNYFQPAMRELMALCVEVWESDPEAFSYHPVGYMQISPEVMHADVASIARQQREIGYTSDLHRRRGRVPEVHAGAVRRLAGARHHLRAARAEGRLRQQRQVDAGAGRQGAGGGRPHPPRRRVTGFRYAGGAVSAVETDQGPIQTDCVVVGVGPWIRSVWEHARPAGADQHQGRDGVLHQDVPMWTYWCLQEGTLGVDPSHGMRDDGRPPPVMHVDTDAPLYSDVDGSLLTDRLWGVYYKPDFCFGGVQGGSLPYLVQKDPDEVQVDPYGPASPEFVVRRGLPRHVVLDARLLPGEIRRDSTRATGTSLRAAWAPSRRTASRCSTSSTRTAT